MLSTFLKSQTFPKNANSEAEKVPADAFSDNNSNVQIRSAISDPVFIPQFTNFGPLFLSEFIQSNNESDQERYR